MSAEEKSKQIKDLYLKMCSIYSKQDKEDIGKCVGVFENQQVTAVGDLYWASYMFRSRVRFSSRFLKHVNPEQIVKLLAKKKYTTKNNLVVERRWNDGLYYTMFNYPGHGSRGLRLESLMERELAEDVLSEEIPISILLDLLKDEGKIE